MRVFGTRLFWLLNIPYWASVWLMIQLYDRRTTTLLVTLTINCEIAGFADYREEEETNVMSEENPDRRRNAFKQALARCQRQVGFWCSTASPICAEILAGAGFDWILIDGEHAPNDIPLLVSPFSYTTYRGS